VDDVALMDAALEQATFGLEAGELPIGSIAVFEDEIVARAFWRRAGGRLAHPELLVLMDADHSLELGSRRRSLSLYTSLEPCLLCMAAAMFSLCGRVVFALESPTDGGTRIGDVWDPGAGSEAPYRFPSIVGGVRRAESAELVREFLRRLPDGPLTSWARTLPI
jgi:tRNA(adenine34) deaminase